MAKTPTSATTDQKANPETEAADVLPAPDDDVEDVAAADNGGAADQQQGDDEPPRRRSARQEAQDRLAEATRLYREKRDREEQESRARAAGEDPADQGAADEADDAGAVDEAADPVSEPVKAAAPAAPSDDAEIELVVYGVPVKRSLKEIKADAQKLLAADQKLEEAKRLVEEAKALKSAQAQRDPDDDPEHPPARGDQRASGGRTDRGNEAEHQPLDELDETALDSIVERIQVGDKDDGRAAIADLARLIRSSKTSALDETKVSDIVRHSLRQVDTEKEIQTAVNNFATKFPTIASDDEFVGVALARVERELVADLKAAGVSEDDLSKVKSPNDLAVMHGRMRQSGAKLRTYDELLTSVGTHFTTKFGQLAPSQKTTPARTTPSNQPADPPTSTAQKRQDMKRAAQTQPRAAGARAPVSQAPRPKTHAEIVAEMRRQRRFD